jgi:hypothetical protein
MMAITKNKCRLSPISRLVGLQKHVVTMAIVIARVHQLSSCGTTTTSKKEEERKAGDADND